MGFWGWRPVLMSLCISVWVVGCNIVSDSAPNASPTDTPRVTLTVRRIATATPTPTRRVTAQAATAAPSPTGAPTATPQLYEIQAGDTLGDIALRFNVDITRLLDANPDVDPRTLQPGQQIIIPTVIAAATDAPTPDATPPELVLAPPACYETPGEDLLCLGLVENTLDYPVEYVEIRVEALRPDGTALESASTTVEQALIRPGETAPYRVLLEVAESDVAGTRAMLMRADSAADVDSRFIRLEVDDEEISVVDGRYVVTATVSNPGDVAAAGIRAVVTILDGERVIGYRVAPVASSLAAGDSTELRLMIVTQLVTLDTGFRLHLEARAVSD